MMRFSSLRVLALTLAMAGVSGVLVNISSPGLYAQVTTAAIHGTVVDSSGAALAGVKVTATDTATGISAVAVSNQSGYFNFPSLQIGPYTVVAEATGFEKFQSSGITLQVNANLEINAKLKIGNSTETVTVDASELQVETSNTQLQQTVTSWQIDNLPLLNRDASSLQKLAPGVVESSDRFGTFSSNGSQTASNSFQLDGVDINDGPLQSSGFTINPDALDEENIVASTINPEFARNGGAVINQVTKSGTNQIHGSGFEYFRDTFMNNRDYFGLTKPPYHRNLYGGTLGFPILKNKLFGFAGYQGNRRVVGSTQQTAVFQNGVVSNGNFTNEANVNTGSSNSSTGLSSNLIPFTIKTSNGTCGPGTSYKTWGDLTNSTTGVVTPGCFSLANGTSSNVTISPSNFNSIAAKLAQKYVPAGNSGTSSVPYYNFNTANKGGDDQGILRADYHINDQDSIAATGLFESDPVSETLSYGGGNLPGFGEINARHIKIFSLQETHTFNSNLLNLFHAGYYRLNYASVTPQKVVSPSSWGFDINPQSSESGLPYMNLTGLFSLGFAHYGPQPRIDTNMMFSDNLSWTFGKHNLKLGGSVEQFRVSNAYDANNNGNYSYAGGGTYSSGDPGIDFLLGIPDSYTQTSGGQIIAEAWEYYAYAQDSWRVTPDLTVNYGLAWDTETPNSNNQFGGLGINCFQLGSTTSTVFPGGFPGLLFPGDKGCNREGGATTKYDHFAPRFGFAWSPSRGPASLLGPEGAHQFAIRGGIGLYYNRDQEEGQLQNLGDIPNEKISNGVADLGGSYSPAFANPFSDVAGNGSETNPFPYSRPKAGAALNWSNFTELSLSVIDKNYSTPYVLNFNLNIQRQLPSNMVLQIGYVGSLGRHLSTIYEGDPITSAGHAACQADVTCIANRAYQHLDYVSHTAQPYSTNGVPEYLSVGTVATEGTSNYNSLQVSLNKNLTHGLFFTLAYTYSHGLDTASGLESSGFNGIATNTIPGYKHLSYGDSDYDARHRIVASYDYEVPLLNTLKQNAIVNELLSKWHVNGVTALQAGFPVTITNQGTYNSLWCDSNVFYACADNANTTNFHIQKMDIRKTGKWFAGRVKDGGTFYQEGATAAEPNTVSNYGTFGNVKRNFFHGPGFDYTNMSVYKDFPFGRNSARSLQLMLQASNVFNHANFAAPDSNYTDGPQFGTVTATVASSTADSNGDPTGGRTVQIAAKFHF
jgi:hypothetical protein